MNTTRMWTLASIVVIVAVVAGTWFVGISPKLEEAEKANADRSTVEAQNQIHEAKLASLKQQAERIDELKGELDALHKAVPNTAELSVLINQISTLAANAGVTITQLTTSDPVRFVPSEVEQEDSELVAALSSVNEENFLAIPIGINVTGTYGQAMAFVKNLQKAERLILVHGLSLSKGSAVQSAEVEYAITGQAFVFLDQLAAAQQQAEATTAAAG
jgi:Tfp pilus assembly protein PilO